MLKPLDDLLAKSAVAAFFVQITRSIGITRGQIVTATQRDYLLGFERWIEGHQRYHESLDNLALADVYFERGESILRNRQRIKRNTLAERRFIINGMLLKMKTDEQNTSLNEMLSCSICLTTDTPGGPFL